MPNSESQPDKESRLFLVLASMAVGVLLTLGVVVICAPSAFALLGNDLVCVDTYRAITS